MHSARNFFFTSLFVVLVVAILGGFLWANLQFLQSQSGGVELFVPWKAVRNFAFQAVTPYGDLTRLNIQDWVYGKPIEDSQYPYRVSIPMHLLLLYLPIAWIPDFIVARAVWLVLVQVALVIIVVFPLRMMRWKPPVLVFGFLLLLNFFGYPAVVNGISGSTVILQIAIFLLALRALETGVDELAGFLLAVTLINVEITGILQILILIWVISNDRGRVVAGYVMTLVILITLSFVLLPGWVLPYISSVWENWQSGALISTHSLFSGWMPGIGNRLANILAVVALAVMLLEWRSVIGQSYRWLFWTSCLTIAIAPLLGIPFMFSWLGFGLPGNLLVLIVMCQRWSWLGLTGGLLIMAGIFTGLWFSFVMNWSFVFIFVYPVIQVALLYWVRWGAIRPPRLWADELRSRG